MTGAEHETPPELSVIGYEPAGHAACAGTATAAAPRVSAAAVTSVARAARIGRGVVMRWCSPWCCAWNGGR